MLLIYWVSFIIQKNEQKKILKIFLFSQHTVLGKLWSVIGRACVVCKKELLYVQPFGLACYLWGSLFIDRQNKNAAKASINVEAKAINDKMVNQFDLIC